VGLALKTLILFNEMGLKRLAVFLFFFEIIKCLLEIPLITLFTMQTQRTCHISHGVQPTINLLSTLKVIRTDCFG